MKKYIYITLLLLGSASALAGELVNGATVVEIANNNSGAEFVIKTSGGSGICTNTFITFPESRAPSPTAHKHGIANAMLAFVAGKKVRVHNFIDNSCSGASFISVSN